ncbi:hypothetical protein PICSAR191_04261 [Mycobacterium avium subsp. paratuberculosis]|nr:hypothetical protein PICSAR14_04467 [Mycobacterium avium subsp. paratuberculosis]CAG7116725.1 hypothetical protein PICSAR191_04261 [Mycobacterium avium subsp. paratuberculosis]CAG7207962.1 hypothetical protein PICSAR246_04360 [Mycobacterium avium subsp. paratuberculosis]CAG7300983.1 hypothetical protein PICSAR46_04255 [Mycobacterium avium subsp. paratuberculosis]CAG7347872.1 hypothetical protein PICSAR64_04335 [Mycobacterium avium subsp. paratuberculosis]
MSGTTLSPLISPVAALANAQRGSAPLCWASVTSDWAMSAARSGNSNACNAARQR